jgi:hypothetical protein
MPLSRVDTVSWIFNLDIDKLLPGKCAVLLFLQLKFALAFTQLKLHHQMRVPYQSELPFLNETKRTRKGFLMLYVLKLVKKVGKMFKSSLLCSASLKHV